ncbi:MAG: CDP-alcohol phosphatidyltransferase family protein [Candidatus Dormibacteraeota bacterium]|nr:CDP-alcohol phosphatidyltransferase family protein [Candidatus Dormibacteraeota bacterium]
MFTTRIQAWVRRNALRVGRLLGHLPVTPNMITVGGTLITLVAAVLTGLQHLLVAAIVLIFAGTFDILDGALARATKRSYPYGAFLDSSMDRIAEAGTYIGIAAFFLFHEPDTVWYRLGVLACLCAISGSFLVSYVRARAQSLGFTCDTGLFQRPERVVATVVGLLLGAFWTPYALAGMAGLIAIITSITAFQRIGEVWGQAKEQRRTARKERAEAPRAGERTAP